MEGSERMKEGDQGRAGRSQGRQEAKTDRENVRNKGWANRKEGNEVTK